MITSRQLRTALPAVVVAMVAVAAFFEAQGVNQLVSASMTEGPVAQPHHASVDIEQPTAPSGDAVLARNPFDSETGPLLDGPAPNPPIAGGEPAPVSMPAEEDPACDFGRVVLITAVEPATDSFAAIELGPGDSSLVRQGDDLQGRTVAAIDWDRVWLRQDDDRHCQLRLGAKAPAGGSRLASNKAKQVGGKGRLRPKGSRGMLDPRLAKKIDRISDTEIRVERSLLEELMKDPHSLNGLARIRKPRNGQKGARLSRVRKGSLPDLLGVKNGDVIETINGLDATNPRDMLQLYGMLQRTESLQVQLQRNNKPLVIDVTIH